MEMRNQDRRALLAAQKHVQLIAWLHDYPGQPVPAQLLREAMDTMSDVFIDRLIARLHSGLFFDPTPIAEHDPDTNEPDPSPASAT